MNPVKTTVHIGLSAPVRALHLTDTHFCLTDEYDPPRLREIGAMHQRAFEGDDPGCTRRYWDEAVSYAHENNLVILHTGDLFDFFSHGNAVLAKELLENENYLFAVGNHDLSHCPGESKDNFLYRMEQLPKIQPFFRQPLPFASRVIGGINFVALDDTYYLFTDWQREQLQHEAQRGLPVVLMIHHPLFTDKFVNRQPDEATCRFIDYVMNEPAIRTVLAGHEHVAREMTLPSGVTQYITGCGGQGQAREFTFV